MVDIHTAVAHKEKGTGRFGQGTFVKQTFFAFGKLGRWFGPIQTVENPPLFCLCVPEEPEPDRERLMPLNTLLLMLFSFIQINIVGLFLLNASLKPSVTPSETFLPAGL